jgi:hypothetical protein
VKVLFVVVTGNAAAIQPYAGFGSGEATTAGIDNETVSRLRHLLQGIAVSGGRADVNE